MARNGGGEILLVAVGGIALYYLWRNAQVYGLPSTPPMPNVTPVSLLNPEMYSGVQSPAVNYAPPVSGASDATVQGLLGYGSLYGPQLPVSGG